jgi:hypothetical protein
LLIQKFKISSLNSIEISLGKVNTRLFWENDGKIAYGLEKQDTATLTVLAWLNKLMLMVKI